METKMDTYQGLLEQADKLRLQTLEELCKLLTPVQGARASVAAFVIVFMMRTMGGNSTLMRSMSASGLTLEEAIVVDSVITVQNLVTVPIPAGGLATGTSDQAVTLSFPILPAPVFTDAVGVQSSASTLLEVHHNVEEHREDPPSQHPAVVISDISHSTAEKLHIVAPSRSTPHSALMRPILGTDHLDYPGFDVLRHHPGAFSSDPPNRDLVQLGENFSEAFTHGRSEALLGTGGVDNCNVPGATQCKTPCKTDEPSIESKEVCRYGFKGRAAA